MSRFYAEIQGTRGVASRCGDKRSGMWCHIRGWDVGCYVRITYDEKNDRDVVTVYRTGGSNGCNTGSSIIRFSDKPLDKLELEGEE